MASLQHKAPSSATGPLCLQAQALGRLCPRRSSILKENCFQGVMHGIHYERTVAPVDSSASLQELRRRGVLQQYPQLDTDFPGIELVHSDPPVFVFHGLLSDEECDDIVASATAGQLAAVEYYNAMLLDTQRLWPLGLVVLAGGVFDLWQSLQTNISLNFFSNLESFVVAGIWSLSKWGLLIGSMVVAIQLLLPMVVAKVFTGSKWSARSSRGPTHKVSPQAAAALLRFVTQISLLSYSSPQYLEMPNVTRYRTGEYQRAHFDGRPAGDPQGLQEFMETGGQRMVQALLYLNTLTPEQQGGTQFHHPSLGGLTIQPRKGDALLFFPAFSDGQLDRRMQHSGAAVVGEGVEKWTCNTWVCQAPLPASCSAAVVAELGRVQASAASVIG